MCVVLVLGDGQRAGPWHPPCLCAACAGSAPIFPVQGVPVNDLHACGYISIGCEPCTRPVLPNQAEREGRWWWEDAAAVSDACAPGAAAGWLPGRLLLSCRLLEAQLIEAPMLPRLCPALSPFAPFPPCPELLPSAPSPHLPLPQKECGLHSGNVSASSGDEEAPPPADLWPEGSGVQALNKQQLGALLDGPREKDTLVALYAPWCQFCKVGGCS